MTFLIQTTKVKDYKGISYRPWNAGDWKQECRWVRTQGNGSDTYPFLVVEGADGDLLFLAASWAPAVQTQVPRGLGADLHWCNQASVVSR